MTLSKMARRARAEERARERAGDVLRQIATHTSADGPLPACRQCLDAVVAYGRTVARMRRRARRDG